MDIKTKAMGVVSIVEKQIIQLDNGFFGFPEKHRFALIDAAQKPFIWVQCMDDPDLAFLAVDPFLFRVFALITIPADGSPVTANLQGPLVINKKNNKAMQAIHPDPKWTTKHDIAAELAAARESQC